MDLSSLTSPLENLRSGRFLVVGYLPTAAATIFVLVLIWAGAPLWLLHGDRLSFSAAWKTAAALGAGEIVLLVIIVTLVAVVLAPFQLSLMRLLEGGWPGSKVFLSCQRRRRKKLRDAAELPQQADALTPATVLSAGRAATQLRRRFPHRDDLMRPTALGNVLAAMEDTAGRDYGMDAVVAWPRLYPLLGDQVRVVVEDRRDTMDAAGRMAVTTALTTVAAVVLLWGRDWWMLLALIPAVLSVVSYRGAVAAAIAYSEAIRSAFDLHRFDLLASLQLPRPATPEKEYELNRKLCDLWRQGYPLDVAYREEK